MYDETRTQTVQPLKHIMLLALIMGLALGISAFSINYGLENIISTDVPMVNYISTDNYEASETAAVANDKGIIDFSNSEEGYVMVKYLHVTPNKLKVQIKGPNDTKYTYDLQAKEWETFPFSAGNGVYNIKIFENVKDTKYRTVLETDCTVNMVNEFIPFIRSNEYVNYKDAPHTIVKSNELCAGATSDVEKVNRIYNFITDNFTYDDNLASTVESGYVPDLDAVLAKKKGICFDYAALTTAMLRVQGIPCKLVVGYTNNIYHAWIRVYLRDADWVGESFYFNGNSWRRLDPTFDSANHGDKATVDYINDDNNYVIKYFY